MSVEKLSLDDFPGRSENGFSAKTRNLLEKMPVSKTEAEVFEIKNKPRLTTTRTVMYKYGKLTGKRFVGRVIKHPKSGDRVFCVWRIQ
jgi:hypothetical protein